MVEKYILSENDKQSEFFSNIVISFNPCLNSFCVVFFCSWQEEAAKESSLR